MISLKLRRALFRAGCLQAGDRLLRAGNHSQMAIGTMTLGLCAGCQERGRTTAVRLGSDDLSAVAKRSAVSGRPKRGETRVGSRTRNRHQRRRLPWIQLLRFWEKPVLAETCRPAFAASDRCACGRFALAHPSRTAETRALAFATGDDALSLRRYVGGLWPTARPHIHGVCPWRLPFCSRKSG